MISSLSRFVPAFCLLIAGCIPAPEPGEAPPALTGRSIASSWLPEGVFRDCPEICPEMTLVSHANQSVAFAVFELTFDEWENCLQEGGCNGYLPSDEGWGRGRRPVINVSWMHAQLYLQWLNEKNGIAPDDPYRYRLPTAAEWGAATGAGPYNWGKGEPNCLRGSLRAAVFRDCMKSGRFDRGTQEVGFSSPLEGLYDMHGNVAEWTDDCLDETCSLRGLKGGSWQDDALFLESDRIDAAAADTYGPITGFRVARTLRPPG